LQKDKFIHHKRVEHPKGTRRLPVFRCIRHKGAANLPCSSGRTKNKKERENNKKMQTRKRTEAKTASGAARGWRVYEQSFTQALTREQREESDSKVLSAPDLLDF
jgi:hypothetical protein